MKKSLATIFAAAAALAFADVAPAPEGESVPAVENESSWTDRLSGFGNYGIYSGYQLYGSLVNSEPTLQGYVEVNAALSWDGTDLGSLGVGLWSNTDLTDKRRGSYGKAFNEWIEKAIHGPRLSRSNYVCGGCLSIHKEAFKRVSFDAWIPRGEDLDYLLNLRMFGADMWFDNKWCLRHLPRGPRGFRGPAGCPAGLRRIPSVRRRHRLPPEHRESGR